MKKTQEKRKSSLGSRKRAPAVRKPRGLGHERRDEILAAAKQLFITEGYETVTTRKLAESVGLSQTGLYVYFRSKEEILDALCRTTFEELARQIRRAGNEAKDDNDRLSRLIRSYVAFGLTHPDEYQLTFMVKSSAPKFLQPKKRSLPFARHGAGVQSFLLIREQVAIMMHHGFFKSMDVTTATEIIWAAAHGLVSLLIARPGFVSSKRAPLIRALEETLLSGLQNLSSAHTNRS